MLDLPNGFLVQNGRRHMSNQTPLSFHRQPENPGSGNIPAGAGFFAPQDQSFSSAHDEDLNFPFLLSGAQPFEMGQNFMPQGTPGIPYVTQPVGGRFASTPDLLSMPSGVPGHAFPSHYSSIYESNLTANTPHYSSGLSQLQSVNNALSFQSHSSVLHASSPCESDSSFDEPGSGYSSPSMTPQRNTNMNLPSHADTEVYLRTTLEIPLHLPVDLSALPEATDKKQPPITHMIKLAIWGSKDKMLTLRGIYNEIEKRYPALKDLQDKPWQRSIRHNLSLKAMFVRLERPPNVPGSGHYWAIDIRNGEGNKRDRKRKDPGSRGSSSRSRSDEDFSEEVEEDRPASVGRRLHGEHKGLRILRDQHEHYGAIGPAMFPPASMQPSHVGYQPIIPPSRIERPAPQPHPPQMGTSNTPGLPEDYSAYPRGASLPSNIEHRAFYRTNYEPIMDQIPFGPYVPDQMSMANMAAPMTGHQMPTLGPAPYGQGSALRRHASIESQDSTRRHRRRNVD